MTIFSASLALMVASAPASGGSAVDPVGETSAERSATPVPTEPEPESEPEPEAGPESDPDSDSDSDSVPPSETVKRPGPKTMRAEEDWGAFGKAGVNDRALDRLKYIRLGGDKRDAYLSLGGQLRMAYEQFANRNLGEIPQDDTGSFLVRIMPHANLRIGPHFRTFVEIKSALETGRDGGPGPIDENRLDLHQGFAELSIGDPRASDKPSLSGRVGRQELYYGGGRLVDLRDGLNVRRSFDALVARFDSKYVRIDGLFAVDVPVRPGVFDDGVDLEDRDRTRLWGGYGETKALELGNSDKRGRKHVFDLYYLGVDQKSLVFIQGAGDEVRHSIGGRWSSSSRGLTHDLEATFQWGDFQDGETATTADILAWGTEGTIRYVFFKNRFAPSLYGSFGVQSGDTDPTDGRLETYRAPFPNLRWAGVTTGYGPGNAFGGTFSVGMAPSRTVHLDATLRAGARLSDADASYSAAGFPLRFADSEERYTGTGVGLSARWTPHPLVTGSLRGEMFEPGAFFKEVDPSDTVWFVTAVADFKF